jgi:hypothetical protein
MDPLTAANTLATIVQLVGMFKQEHQDAKDANHQKFIEWLQYHRHEDIKNLICNTAAIQAEVTNLLRQDTATILAKLEVMNSTLATLASRIDGFQGLSKSLMPDAELSEQAIFVLKQFVDSGEKTFIFQELSTGAVFQPEQGEPFGFYELRYLSDDIETLEKCGLITLRQISNHGLKIYGITRAGVRYMESISAKGSNGPA